MNFDFYKLPAKPTPAFPNRKNILIPLLKLKLINNTREVECFALIDSGADVCLFPADYGEKIGLKIKNKRFMEIHGIGGGKILAYFHIVTLEIGGNKFPTRIGFTYDPIPMATLGREGFFDLFKVSFDFKKEKIELKPYEIRRI
jgi:hypothetical protein